MDRDEWVKQASLYIRNESEMCECDCWLCANNEHDEHCEEQCVCLCYDCSTNLHCENCKY